MKAVVKYAEGEGNIVLRDVPKPQAGDDEVKIKNVYDSLGEGYLQNGQAELAIKFYKKSLELNPQNINAVDMLKRIEEKK